MALFLFSFNSFSVSVNYLIISFGVDLGLHHTLFLIFWKRRGEKEVWLINMFPKQNPKPQERKENKKMSKFLTAEGALDVSMNLLLQRKCLQTGQSLCLPDRRLQNPEFCGSHRSASSKCFLLHVNCSLYLSQACLPWTEKVHASVL